VLEYEKEFLILDIVTKIKKEKQNFYFEIKEKNSIDILIQDLKVILK